VHYVCVYYPGGLPYPSNTGYFGSSRPYWGLIGFYVLQQYENQGYGPCGATKAESTIRTDFADGPVVIGDVDKNGINEYIVIGNTYYCDYNEDPAFNGVHIVNADRTRWKNTTLGFDWDAIPNPATGPPVALGEYYTVIQDNQNNAALGDIDGDGYLEIVYPSYDGKMHAYWLDKTEHFSWPFNLATLSTKSAIVFASEPILVDIDNDGKVEVIFGTWTELTSLDWGYIVILNYDGTINISVQLPIPQSCVTHPTSCDKWNGVMAAPTIFNIDTDPNYEVIMLSVFSGTLAYRLPNSASARIVWGTGRGNFQRTASVTLPTVGAGTPPSPHKNPASVLSPLSVLLQLCLVLCMLVVYSLW